MVLFTNLKFLYGRIFLVITFSINSFCNDEARLHEDLLSNDYNPTIRPAETFSKPLHVFFDFVLEEVKDLNVKEQYLDISAFVVLAWKDPNLAWNKFEYGGVDETLIDTEFVWRPDLALHNRDDLHEDPLYYASNTKVLVKNDGNVTWVIYNTWKSSCSTDVTWWPVDQQKCIMTFGSLTYDRRRLSLMRSKTLARIDHAAAKKRMMSKLFGVDSGQWLTVNLSSSETYSKRPCGISERCEFSTVSVELGLRRMPLYFFLYTIFPLCALILTFLLIFHLDIGQRASYGVAILLSISVYLITISEFMPRKSDVTPFLGCVFIFDFFLLCVAVPIAEFTAHLAQKSDGHPPAWCSKIVQWSPKSLFNIRGGTVGYSLYDSVALGESAEDVFKDNLAHKDYDSYRTEWRKVGRFFDVAFSLIFLVLMIISPIIIGVSLEPYNT